MLDCFNSSSKGVEEEIREKCVWSGRERQREKICMEWRWVVNKCKAKWNYDDEIQNTTAATTETTAKITKIIITSVIHKRSHKNGETERNFCVFYYMHDNQMKNGKWTSYNRSDNFCFGFCLKRVVADRLLRRISFCYHFDSSQPWQNEYIYLCIFMLALNGKLFSFRYFALSPPTLFMSVYYKFINRKLTQKNAYLFIGWKSLNSIISFYVSLSFALPTITSSSKAYNS